MAPNRKKKFFTEALIKLIANHPAIWNKTCKDYKDSVVRSNAWANVKASLDSKCDENDLKAYNLHTLQGIKSHWKNLQDTYRNKKKKSHGQSGAGLDQVLEPKEWEFFEALKFLDESGKYGNLIKSSSSHVELFFGEETSEEEEEDEVERSPEDAGDEGEHDEVEDGEEEDPPVLPADRHDPSPSSPAGEVPSAQGGQGKRTSTSDFATRSIKKNRKSTSQGEGWAAVVEACQALGTRKTPKPLDADEAFGQFVVQRLKAMTEPRKTKCLAEIMQSLLTTDSPVAEVQAMSVVQQPPSLQLGAVGPPVGYFQTSHSPWIGHPPHDPNIRLRTESKAISSLGDNRLAMVAPPVPSQPRSSAESNQTATPAPTLFKIGPGVTKINPFIRGQILVTS